MPSSAWKQVQARSPNHLHPPPKVLMFSPSCTGRVAGCMGLRWWDRNEEHLVLEMWSHGPAYSNGRQSCLVA